MPRRLVRSTLAVALNLVVIAGALAADDAGQAALKEKGLAASGTVYVLADEAPLLESLKNLKNEKIAADRDTLIRRATEAKITANQNLISKGRQEWEELEARLGRIKDVSAHNGVVTRMNSLNSKMKEASVANKGHEETLRKITSANKTKYVDDLLELAPRFEAATAKYKVLAEDAAVKASLAKAHATLGPSKEFSEAAADVSAWKTAVDSEVIATHGMAGDVQEVDVTINGESVKMMVDTGATFVCLPGEMAEKLKIVPDQDAPAIKLQLADGNMIEGRQIIVGSVRVGRFTAQNVACAVLQKGLPNAMPILGNSYLARYVVKLDLQRKELQLTEIKAASDTPTSRPAASVVK